MVLESVLVSLFYKWLTSFPSTTCFVFSPLYIFASFVKDKVSIGAWIYLWAFCFVPLIYISVFVPVPYCLDDCGFVVETEVRQVDSSSSILLEALEKNCFPRYSDCWQNQVSCGCRIEVPAFFSGCLPAATLLWIQITFQHFFLTAIL